MKKLKHLLKGGLISLLASSMFLGSTMSFEVSAAGSSYFLNYTGYAQAKSNWSWAAAAETSAKHSVSSSKQDQWSAVRYVMGTNTTPYPNTYANISQTAKAANFIANNKVTYVGEENTKTHIFLTQQLANGKMPLLHCEVYFRLTKTNNRTVVLYGTTLENGNTFMYYYDPVLETENVTSSSNLYMATAAAGDLKYIQTCYIK